jgi:ankyrin repeat protein
MLLIFFFHHLQHKMSFLYRGLLPVVGWITYIIACHGVYAQDSSSSNALLELCLGPESNISELETFLLKSTTAKQLLNARDPASGQTCLMASVLRGKVEFVRLLLEHGADPNIPEKDGYTPPHGAAFQGRTEVMKVLLEFGVVPKDNDDNDDNASLEKQYHRDGFVPFHRACWGRTERHAELVEYMLESGIVRDAEVRSKDGLTCRDMTRNPATLAILDRTKSKSNVHKEL